jgi:threonine dehydrogenase-like Zn-dependent dehydrogenase
VVAELVGLPSVIPEGLQMLRSGGSYLEIGCISAGQTHPIDPAVLTWGNMRIVGVLMYDPWTIPEALEFLVRTKDKYPHQELVSQDKFKLEEIDKAFEAAEWQAAEGTKVRRVALVP